MEKEQEHCLNLNWSSRAGSGRKKTASRIYRGTFSPGWRSRLVDPTGTKGPPFISWPSPSSSPSSSSAHFEAHCTSVLASSLPPLFLHPFFDSSVDFFDSSVDSSVVNVTNLILSFFTIVLSHFVHYIYMVLYCGFFSFVSNLSSKSLQACIFTWRKVKVAIKN